MEATSGSKVSPLTWAPTLELDEALLPADALIRNFQSGKAGYVADAVEQALLLPKDMSDWRSMRKHEVFHSLKRDLVLAVQAAHRAEEIFVYSHRLAKDEESRRVAAVKAFEVAEKKSQNLTAKLAEVEHDKKSAEATLAVVERQTEAQRKQLRQAKDELTAIKGQIKTLVKKLEEAKKAKEFYCLQVWNEALDRAGVEASFALKSAENVYYPPAICASSSSISMADLASKEVDEGKGSPNKTLPPADVSSLVAEQAKDAEKVDDAPNEPAKNALKEPMKEKEAPQHMKIVLASLSLPPKEDPKGKGPYSTTTDSTQALKTQKDKQLVIKMKS
ncbi:hypothetical protein SO802_026447 [Lithocarpus litseifolius]|uniref:Uncharacterized protein n=1 Tax=Lithocarpus litseifolius TaxID=425828 RepID=A0AAW2C1H0_9ROSI